MDDVEHHSSYLRYLYKRFVIAESCELDYRISQIESVIITEHLMLSSFSITALSFPLMHVPIAVSLF